MRPSAGDDAFGRPRIVGDETPSFGLPPGPQMTYFFAEESAIGPPQQPSSVPFCRSKDTGCNATSNCRKNPAAPDNMSSSPSHHDLETGSTNTAGARPPSCRGVPDSLARHAKETMSLPPTPPLRPSALASNLSPGPSGPSSALSSVSSRRGSFNGSLSDGLGSRTPSLYNGGGGGVSVIDDGDRDDTPQSMIGSGGAPQLVMPSIKMPSRRPFTDEGKSLGRLKVLIAGDSAVGKTSLIEAIVQSCEHIVHVDPVTPSLRSSVLRRSTERQRGAVGSGSWSGNRRSARTDNGTTQITEIYASTKPYPEWWSEIDDFRVLRRRKSLGDSVLDRNICFVDTPGYGSGASSMDTITPVASYIESHFRRMSSNSLSDGDTLNLIGGEGGVQVDVVFYLVSNRLRPVDIQYIRQVTPLTNVVLLLAQADLMSQEQISASKQQISSQLKEARINLFSFSTTLTSSSPLDPAKHGLYAISSATGSDHETMDASLLMSRDYVQPLIPTELATLVQQVFSQDGASWLRHSAARKYVQWRRSDTSPRLTSSLFQPSFNFSNPHTQPTPQQARNQVLAPPMGATSSYAIARITDHAQREERLAEVRFANWASDLQKSLANERAQYAALARGERAIWLTQKLNECVQDGTLVPLPGRGRSCSTERIRRQVAQRLRADAAAAAPAGTGCKDGQVMHHQDPLGLLQVAADLRHTSLIALEVVGSLGLVGGLMVWASKYYWHLQAYEWVVGEWDKFWGGGR